MQHEGRVGFENIGLESRVPVFKKKNGMFRSGVRLSRFEYGRVSISQF